MTVVKVVISRRDAADTAIRAGVLNSSLDGQLSPETDVVGSSELLIAGEEK